MKKIGDVTSTADKNGEWTNGNVAAGIAPTILEAGWLNSVQREILGVIIAAGMQQDKNDDTQLSKAISKIISGGDYATKTEVNSKLAKDQNGADIPNKDTFIKNLGLPEKYQSVGYSYSKAESDNKFQPKGSYQQTGNYLNKDSTDVQVVSGEIQSKGRVGAIFGDSGLCFLGSYNGKAAIGAYDGVNFRYVVHPNKTGIMALTSDLIGSGRGWVDMKSMRVAGVNYLNDTGRLIFIFVRLGSSTMQTTEIKCDGKTVGLWTSPGKTDNTSQGAFSAIPPGAYYSVMANQGSGTVLDWMEMVP